MDKKHLSMSITENYLSFNLIFKRRTYVFMWFIKHHIQINISKSSIAPMILCGFKNHLVTISKSSAAPMFLCGSTSFRNSSIVICIYELVRHIR